MASYYQIGAGTDSPPQETKKSSAVATVGILAGITFVIFGLSPGARHYYRHGKLPR